MTTYKRGRKSKSIDKHQLGAVQDEMVAAYENVGTWHAVAAHYGISKAAAHRIANDKTYRPSQATIDKVLIKERPRPWLVEVPPCPDCASVHTGRCNGKPVAEVVTLAPGEIVKQAKPQRQPTPELERIMRAFDKLTPHPVSGRCYNRHGWPVGE